MKDKVRQRGLELEIAKNGLGAWRGLTNEANRPRLHRGAERSRDSEMLRESGRQCRRGPS